MLLKYDPLLRPERFRVIDLSTPVYLQADGTKFVEFSFNAGYCVVGIRKGTLLNQQEICETMNPTSSFFHSKEAAKEFIQREVWRYSTEGFKPASWVPQELNNYLRNKPIYQGTSYSELHETKSRNSGSYQLDQIAKKNLSLELNKGNFIYSYMERLLAEKLKGAYLVRGAEILKIQWRRNVLKIESENGRDYQKEFWQFASEKEALRDADQKIRKLVENGFRFKLEKFIYDFYEDESEIKGKNSNSRRSPSPKVNVIKASQRSQLSPRKSILPPQSKPERRYTLFPKQKQEKSEDQRKIIIDAQLVADKILEGIDRRRKRNDSIESEVGMESVQNYENNSDFQLPPYHGQAYWNSNQRQIFSRPEKLRERSPKQTFQIWQSPFSQDNRKDSPSGPKNLRRMNNKEDGLCVICIDKEASMAFVPCGHKKTCESCCALVMRKDANCPVCRMVIQSTLKIYE